MRIRDYIRDGGVMGRKRENKSARFFPTSLWLPLIFATLSRMLLRLRGATRCAPYIHKGLRYDQSATDIFYASPFFCHPA